MNTTITLTEFAQEAPTLNGMRLRSRAQPASSAISPLYYDFDIEKITVLPHFPARICLSGQSFVLELRRIISIRRESELGIPTTYCFELASPGKKSTKHIIIEKGVDKRPSV